MSAMHPHPQSRIPSGDAEPFDSAAYLDDPESYVAARRDGWTGARQKAFLEILADTGEAEFAAEAVGMTIQSAYALRRRPGGHGFACGWAVALRHAGQRLVDTAYSRALATREEPIVANREVVGTRLKQNDRMLIYLINRIDRINAGKVIDMPAAPDPEGEVERITDGRAIEAHMEEYLACIERDGDEMWDRQMAEEAETEAQFEADCAIRRGLACPVPDAGDGEKPENDIDIPEFGASEKPTHSALFLAKARLRAGTIYSGYDPAMASDADIRRGMDSLFGMPHIDTSDLDTDAAAHWTDDQWDRAHKSGLLDGMDDDWWDKVVPQDEEVQETQDSENARDGGPMDSPKVH